MKPPRWMTEATEPSDDEVAGLTGEAAWSREVAAVLEPTEVEVQALRSRAPSARPADLRWGWVAGLAVAAVVVWLAMPPSEPLFEVPGESVVELKDWAAHGSGTWEERGVEQGTRIVQRDGVVHYDVGSRRRDAGFVVEARDVEVAVVGTAFTVGIEGDDVWVDVLEGVVEIRHDRGSTMVEQGTAWSSAPPAKPAPRAPSLFVPPAVEEPGVPPLAELERLLSRVDAGEADPELADALQDWADAQSGPLAAVARGAAVEVVARGLPAAHRVVAIRRFLKKEPANPRRVALMSLGADAYRNGLRDCASAIPWYRRVAQESEGVRRATAEAWWGLCAASLGEPAVRPLSAALTNGVPAPLRDIVTQTLRELEP